MAIPLQTRRKVMRALERGEAAASIAKRLEIGERTIYRLKARVRVGQPLEPDKTGPRGSVKLTADDERLLREALDERPGITAQEMLPRLSVPVAISTVCRAWIRLGLSRKKKSLRAAEQDRPDVAAGRRFWVKAQPLLDPHSLVFLDEAGAWTNMTTQYGRSPVGERCVDATPHGHWKTQTMLSAIRLDGVMRDATVVVDGAMDADVFTRYAEQCLAPSLRPGDLVVMDNLSSHHTKAAIEAIESAHASVWFLPPYSPDLNPIEKLWSKVKAWLRRAAAKTLDGLSAAIAAALRTATPEECWNYFASCGYCR